MFLGFFNLLELELDLIIKLIQLQIPPEQIRKLRKMIGIKKKPKHKGISGSGVNLIIDESNYNALTFF